MAASVEVTDPKGKKKPIVPKKVIMVFFSRFLSPPGANSILNYAGTNRNFQETTKQAADILDDHITLLNLTLPKGNDAFDQAIWVNVDKIGEVFEADNGARVELEGLQDTVNVLETKQEIDKAIGR